MGQRFVTLSSACPWTSLRYWQAMDAQRQGKQKSQTATGVSQRLHKIYRKVRKATLTTVQAKQTAAALAQARAETRTAMARATALADELALSRLLVSDQAVHIQQMGWLSGHYGRVPPIPPKHLQQRVSGDYYWQFFMHGAHMLADIDRALTTQGLSLSTFERILDFGCGCGRFLIPLSQAVAPARLSGCDIDAEAIGWLSAHYPQLAGLVAGPHEPRSPYADESFDFVYGVSVFTHLPEDMQFAWLAELQRITKKGGWLVLTTHGRKFINEMPTKYHADFNERGFYYLDEAGITDGLPTFYKGAYHLHHYIEREWSKYFRVVSISDQGIGAHQDLVLLQNTLA